VAPQGLQGFVLGSPSCAWCALNVFCLGIADPRQGNGNYQRDRRFPRMDWRHACMGLGCPNTPGGSLLTGSQASHEAKVTHSRPQQWGRLFARVIKKNPRAGLSLFFSPLLWREKKREGTRGPENIFWPSPTPILPLKEKLPRYLRLSGVPATQPDCTHCAHPLGCLYHRYTHLLTYSQRRNQTWLPNMKRQPRRRCP
jgi:hypothetical protein